MSPNRACWRRAAVGVVVGLCALAASTAYADTNNPVCSLSGYVYLDKNRNMTLDPGDWAIVGAKVQLTNAQDPNFMLWMLTDSYGRYCFDGPSPGDNSGLSAGTYTIALLNPAGLHGMDNKGQLLDLQTGLAVFPQDWGDEPQQDNSFTNIKLSETTRGVEYNFGQFLYPIELISKQMLLTTYENNPVPEPGMLALLAGGTLIVCVRSARRRRQALPPI